MATRQRQMNVEQALETVGSLGRFQVLSFIFIFLPALFHMARMSSVTFAVEYRPKHRCALPGLSNDSYVTREDDSSFQHQAAVNQSVPPGDSCQMYNASRSYSYYIYDKYHRPVGANASGDLVPCPDGWVYDQSVISNTDSMKFNLVCDQTHLASYIDMSVMFGSIIGACIVGLISDRYGRIIGFLCAVPVCVGAGIAITWAPSYTSLAILFALAGAGCSGMFTCFFVLALESVLPAYRYVPALLMQIFLPLGQIMLAAIGVGVRDWRWINVVISAPAILFLFYYWFLTESPFWLNAHGKLEELKNLFVKMARANRRMVKLTDDEIKEELENMITDKEEDVSAVKDSIKDMFTSCVLCVRTLVTFLNWFAVNYDYYGLILFSAHLGSGLYTNFFLSAVVEIPAHVVSLLLANRLGRKPVHCCYFLLVIASTGGAIAMKAGDVGSDNAVLALTLIGKFGAAGLLGTSFLWTVEMYPVSVRSTGAGIMAVAAKLGAIVVPLVIEKGKAMDSPLGDAIPYIGFCSISIIAFLAVLILPETCNRTLPTTVAEARLFGLYDRLPNVFTNQEFNVWSCSQMVQLEMDVVDKGKHIQRQPQLDLDLVDNGKHNI